MARRCLRPRYSPSRTMSDVILPDDVRDFILGHIDSVAQLEALLLLRNYAEFD